ncbi:arsenate reductase (glutaredoxin) [Lysobacter sp. GX 14042]|uniref:arsenate reductase (glutaredoxin) n=1 Tax=Lysobacter sp. GX 14042 TaxID=2907155 RepID=UPI001EEABE5E|nr:arsenate reductase (glutaredoxin) [Lysobacter sp. GX 14042]MCE7031496.1 arsenate reductase (glutaredoxin) [Lysobacter sp. GX 14042]
MANDTSRLYHNPRCSKSRGALELLRENGIEPEVIRYLDTPPNEAQLRALLDMLGIPARGLLRKGEDEYRELGLDDPSLGEEEIIAAMARHPKLIERPVFVHDGRAVIGRPPEQVLGLL